MENWRFHLSSSAPSLVSFNAIIINLYLPLPKSFFFKSLSLLPLSNSPSFLPLLSLVATSCILYFWLLCPLFLLLTTHHPYLFHYFILHHSSVLPLPFILAFLVSHHHLLFSFTTAFFPHFHLSSNVSHGIHSSLQQIFKTEIVVVCHFLLKPIILQLCEHGKKWLNGLNL